LDRGNHKHICNCLYTTIFGNYVINGVSIYDTIGIPPVVVAVRVYA